MEETKRKTQTSSAGKRKYNRKAYGAVTAYLPKEMAEAFKQKCAETGISQAAIVRAAVEKFLADNPDNN